MSTYLNTRYNSAGDGARKARLTASPGEPAGSSKPANLSQLMAAPVPEPFDVIGFPDYVVNVVYEKYVAYPGLLLPLASLFRC